MVKLIKGPLITLVNYLVAFMYVYIHVLAKVGNVQYSPPKRFLGSETSSKECHFSDRN